jgi:uncharacterized membrane protein YtjA (UPF0391 family)
MPWLTMILFAVLAIVCGFWAFAGGFSAGVAIGKVLFWVFLVLFILSVLGGWPWPRSRVGG